MYGVRHKWLALPNDGATEMRTVMFKGPHLGVDDRLQAWLADIEQLDHRTVSISVGLLQARAVEIGRALKLDDLRASWGYLRGFLSRTGIKSVRMHCQGGAVEKEAAERGMEVVRKGLEAYRARTSSTWMKRAFFSAVCPRCPTCPPRRAVRRAVSNR